MATHSEGINDGLFEVFGDCIVSQRTQIDPWDNMSRLLPVLIYTSGY